MGLFTDAQQRKAETGKMAAIVTAICPDPLSHYVCDVNRKSANMLVLAGQMNTRYSQGYRLAQAFEQDGNTVTVFEHNHA